MSTEGDGILGCFWSEGVGHTETHIHTHTDKHTYTQIPTLCIRHIYNKYNFLENEIVATRVRLLFVTRCAGNEAIYFLA